MNVGHGTTRRPFPYWRLICLIGAVVWWLVTGAANGWSMLGYALIATAYTVPIAFWLGRDA